MMYTMTKRVNCWEFKKCEREPGGDKAANFGVCPSPCTKELDEVNEGHNGGRSCWCVAGTFCNGKPQGTFVEKFGSCLKCDFYLNVRSEEGDQYVSTVEIRKKMGYL